MAVAITLSLAAAGVAVGVSAAGGESTSAPPVPGSRSGAEGPVEIVALAEEEVVVLDPVTGALARVLATHPRDPGGSPVSLQGLAADGQRREVYYAVVRDGSEGTIRRVSVDGGRRSEKVADGISPAVSPDGRRLAYAAPGPVGAGSSPLCCNTIAVVDLDGGAVRTWRFSETDPAGSWLPYARLTGLAWAPDSRRLAFTLSYEGDTLAVLDTSRHHSLSEALEVVVPGGGGDSRHPAWQASSGRLALVNRAFECCFDDDYTGPTRSLLLEPSTGATDELLPPGTAPEWLDFDASGDHLLAVESGYLYRRSHGGPPVLLAAAMTVHAADW